jgi:hypothetical protein
MGRLSPFVPFSLRLSPFVPFSLGPRVEACGSDGVPRNIELEVNADSSEPWASLFRDKTDSAPEVPPTVN